MLCSEFVEIEWVRHSGDRVRATANLEEIWRCGATLDTEQPVPEGTLLLILRRPVRLACRVRSCRESELGYMVSVEFEEGTEWQPESFLPAHALHVENLAPSTNRAESESGQASGKSKAAGAGESQSRSMWSDEEQGLATMTVAGVTEFPAPGRWRCGSITPKFEDLSPLFDQSALYCLARSTSGGK